MEDGSRKRWMGLVETENGQLLFSPLSKAVKTKYTCIAVSSTHVVLGANTGSLYCFTAKGFKYVRLLANMEGPVSLAKFSPDSKTLAVVVGSNTVGFWETNLDEGNTESKRFHVSTILKGGVVTDIVWDGSTRLFYGDNQGRVALAFIPKISRKFGSSSFFKRGDEIIHNEKSPIVQLDVYKDTLLVSSYQRCCIFRLTNELLVASVTKVGKKERDGPYGALFHPRVHGRPPVVYSARPGGRMWEGDVAGTVLSTIKQRDIITVAPSNILSIGDPFLPAPLPFQPISSLNFSRLILMLNTYLVAWQKDSLFVFHPSSYSLSCWTNVMKDISQVECVNDKMYILHGNCQKITCVSLMDMAGTLVLLMNSPNPSFTCELMVTYSDVIKSEVLPTAPGQSLFRSVIQFLKDSQQDIPSEVTELIALLPVDDDVVSSKDGNVTETADEEEGTEDIDGGEGEQTKEEIDYEDVPLFVPPNDVDDFIGIMEESSLDRNVPVEKSLSIPINDGPVKKVSTMIAEEDGLFQMEDGSPDKGDGDVIIKGQSQSLDQLIRPDNIPFHHSPTPAIINSQSLTTPTLISESPQYPTVPTTSNGSLPTTLEHITLPQHSPGSAPHPTLVVGGTSPVIPSIPSYSTDQAPLSVRMSEGRERTGKPNNDDDVVSISRTKKRKKSMKKKKSNPSKAKSQLDPLEDIFESSIPIEVSPTASRMSSTNPSMENSRASSPLRTESRNSISDLESTSLDPSLERLNPVINDNNGFVPAPQRSQSLDPITSNVSPVDMFRRQSVDFEADVSSRLGIQKPSAILSKVKSIASNQQEKTGRKVKELFSSLSPTPTSGSGGPLSLTPIAAAISPPLSDEITMRMTSPSSPEMGVLPSSVNDGGSEIDQSGSLSPDSVIHDIQTERFLAFTTEAMDSLNDPVTLCSPEQFQQRLCQWRKELTTYTTHLTANVVSGEEFERGRVFLIPPYTHLNLPIQRGVSELVSLTIQNTLQQGEIPDFIDNYMPLIELRDVSEFLGTRLSLEQMKNCWSKLSNCDHVKTHSSNRFVVTHEDSIDKIKEFVKNHSLSYPGILQRVFENDPLKFLQLIFALPDVLLWEVAMVTCVAEDSIKGLEVFGKYLNESLTARTATSSQRIRSKNLSYLHSHNELFMLAVKACLATPPTNDLFIGNQRPQPLSNRVEWPCEAGLTSLTRLLLVSRNKELYKQVGEMFQEKGYWNGLLCVLKQQQKHQTKELFSLVCDLRDIDVLGDICSSASDSVLNTPDKWKEFLSCLVSRGGVPLVNEGSTSSALLSLEGVVKIMVGTIGVEETCRVLDQVDQLEDWELPPSLQQFLSDAATLHREKRTVAHLLLETLDKHLWAARPPALGPHLHAIYKSKTPMNITVAPTDITHMTPFTIPSSLHVHIQDSGSHWGVKADNEHCGVCGFLVTSKFTNRESSFYGFNCGHFYHRECLPEQACVQCFTKRYSNEINHRMKRTD